MGGQPSPIKATEYYIPGLPASNPRHDGPRRARCVPAALARLDGPGKNRFPRENIQISKVLDYRKTSNF
jgi:hypothetical protein